MAPKLFLVLAELKEAKKAAQTTLRRGPSVR